MSDNMSGKKKLIFATGNPGKLKEIKAVLGDLGYDIVTMKEAGIDIDIVEDGETFEDNALIKAKAVCQASGCLAMADDSGLEVDAMNKEPGVYSARWMGYDTSYDIKNQAIIDKLEGVPDEERTARFVCACAAVFPSGEELVVKCNMEGRIGYEIAGENGFGYDPIFYLPEYGKTSAEITPEEKNAISHRGKALRKMAELLKKMDAAE